MNRPFLSIAAWLGAAAVALGAFGAHGLERMLGHVDDGNVRLGYWKTAALYHLTHALALALAAACAGESKLARLSRLSFCFGIVLFSGSLYLLTISGVRALGAITPVGGVLLITGWVALGLAVRREGKEP